MDINKDKLKLLDTQLEPFKGGQIQNKYVAFIDILGFGHQVLSDFNNTLEIYEDVIEGLRAVEAIGNDVTIQIYSDSILLTSDDLQPLVPAVNAVHMQTLFHNCLVRGGIGYGKHIEVKNENHFYVVSQALVNAVQVEKEIKQPCVAFHKSVTIPDDYWMPDIPSIMRSILHYDGITLVNPVNMFWGTSAMTRVSYMLDEYPEHSDKFKWFLGLCTAISEQQALVPEQNNND